MIEQFFHQGLKSGDSVHRFRVIRPVYEEICVSEQNEDYRQQIEPITAPSSVRALFGFLMQETKEHVIALHLDSKNRLICMEQVSMGSMNVSVVHPREVFKSALLSSAAGIILVHNHPSGDSSPSKEDIDITIRLKEVGDLIGIRLIDHVIIGHHYCSMAESGHC
jgi:DNA repair protein RadC